MSARHVPLRSRFRESWRRLDDILLPGPRDDRTQVFAGLVRSATRIGPVLSNGALIDPIQKLTDLFAPQPFERNSSTPAFPFRDGCAILGLCTSCSVSRTKVLGHSYVESRWHRQTPASPVSLQCPFLLAGRSLCFLLVVASDPCSESGARQRGVTPKFEITSPESSMPLNSRDSTVCRTEARGEQSLHATKPYPFQPRNAPEEDGDKTAIKAFLDAETPKRNCAAATHRTRRSSPSGESRPAITPLRAVRS
jgi:hypothetical protein